MCRGLLLARLPRGGYDVAGGGIAHAILAPLRSTSTFATITRPSRRGRKRDSSDARVSGRGFTTTPLAFVVARLQHQQARCPKVRGGCLWPCTPGGRKDLVGTQLGVSFESHRSVRRDEAFQLLEPVTDEDEVDCVRSCLLGLCDHQETLAVGRHVVGATETAINVCLLEDDLGAVEGNAGIDAKKPIHSPSGEKKGYAAPSVPPMGTAPSRSIERR